MCLPSIAVQGLYQVQKDALFHPKIRGGRYFGTASARLPIIKEMMQLGLVEYHGHNDWGTPRWSLTYCGMQAMKLLKQLEEMPLNRAQILDDYDAARATCPINPIPQTPSRFSWSSEQEEPESEEPEPPPEPPIGEHYPLFMRRNPFYRRNSDRELRELERQFALTGEPDIYKRIYVVRLRQGLTEQPNVALAWIEQQIDAISSDETNLANIPTWHSLVVRAAAMFDEPGQQYSFHGEIYYNPLRDRLFIRRQQLYDAEDLQNELDAIFQEMADERAAEGWSYIGDMPYLDYGEDLKPHDLWQSAEIGYAFAVDSELVKDGTGEFLAYTNDKDLVPPKGFVLLNTGGHVFGEEQEITVEFAIDRLASRLSIDGSWVVEQLYGGDGPPELVYFSSHGGDVEMYGNPEKIYDEYIA